MLSCGIDVHNVRKNPNPTDFLNHRRITLALDIGAKVGQFGNSLRRHGHGGKIALFEPVRAVFRQLATEADPGHGLAQQKPQGPNAGRSWDRLVAASSAAADIY